MREGEERQGWLQRYRGNLEEAVGRGEPAALCLRCACFAVPRCACCGVRCLLRRAVPDALCRAVLWCARCAAPARRRPTTPLKRHLAPTPAPATQTTGTVTANPTHSPAHPPTRPPPPAAGIVEPAESGLIMDHIENFDFPERPSTWRQLAADAGFASFEELFVDSKQFGRLALLRKAAAAGPASLAAAPQQ